MIAMARPLIPAPAIRIFVRPMVLLCLGFVGNEGVLLLPCAKVESWEWMRGSVGR